MKPNMAAVMMPHTRCTHRSRNDLLLGVVAQNRDDFGASKIAVYAGVHRCFERRILYFPVEFSSVLFRKTTFGPCQILLRPQFWSPRHTHCNRKSVVVHYHARLLLILGPLGFPRLFELPLCSCFTPATVKPRCVRSLLHRLRPCSKLIYVSRRIVRKRRQAR